MKMMMSLVEGLFREVQKTRMKLFLLLIISCLALPFLSCVKDQVGEPAIDQTRQYFPLVPGKFITYAIDSIVFDDIPGGNKKDSVHFELREQITEFQVQNGDTVFYIHRS